MAILPVFYNADVSLSVEVSFADNPLVAAPTWVDISTDVRSFSIRRGRSHELDTFAAGNLTLTLDNNAGNYDPSSTGSAYYPNVKPMKQVRVRASYSGALSSGVEYGLFRGFVDGWPAMFDHADDTVTVQASDGFKVLNMVKDASVQVEEDSSVRVGNLLDSAGWPAALRTLSTGITTAIGYTPVCEAVLSLIHTVEDTEQGQFFIAGNGNATFHNQTWRSALTVGSTFGDSGAEVKYQAPLKGGYDDTQIWNQVEVVASGLPSTVNSTASQDSYGIRTLVINDTLHTTTTDADDSAAVLLARYKDPHMRIETMRILPEAGSFTETLGAEISNKIRVKRRAKGGQTVSVDAYVEGVSHDVSISPKQWETKLSLSQYD